MAGKRTIVVVDDNKDILFTVTEIFRAKDIEVIPCMDHRDVQKIIGNEFVQLYIVDYHLPEKDGAEIVRMIRKTDKRTPIIMLTVEESPEVVQRVKEAGADDYALKPIRALDLISRVEAHLLYRDQARYYSDRSCGINDVTLNKIRDILLAHDEFIETEQIAEESGVSYKSTCRYIKYMTERGMLDVDYKYEKQGRPRSCYRLKQNAP